MSRGYHSTSVDQIADGANLSKGAIFFYFDNKEAILHALLDDAERLMVDDMIERVAEAGPSWSDKLVAFVHGQSALGIDKADYVLLFILMLLEFSGRKDAIEKRVRRIYRRFYRAIEEIIEAGKASGEFRSDVSTKELASVVVASHNGTLMEWYCRADELDGEELVRALRSVLVVGITTAAGGANAKDGVSSSAERRTP